MENFLEIPGGINLIHKKIDILKHGGTFFGKLFDLISRLLLQKAHVKVVQKIHKLVLHTAVQIVNSVVRCRLCCVSCQTWND